MPLEVGDLIFVRGADFVGRVIEWAENGIYSHVAIYAGNGKVLEAQGFRKTGYQDLAAYKGRYDIGHVQGATYLQRTRVRRFAESKRGTRYAWKAIAVLALRLVFHLDIPYNQNLKDFICSFYAEDAWEAGGRKLTNVKNPTPQDLADSPDVVIERLT